MARFTAREAVSFADLRALCYQNLPVMDLMERVTERLEHVVGADASCSHELDLATGFPTRAVMRGWPQAAKPVMIENVMLVSPATQVEHFHRSGRRVRTVAEIVADSETPEADPYYTHHLWPFGFEHEVQVLCSVRGESHAVIALTRRPEREPYADRDQRFLAALAPHIGAGVARARVRELLASPRAADIGMIVVDQRGRVELANHVAEEWLAADERAVWPYGLPLLGFHLAKRGLDGDDARFAPLVLPHPVTGGYYGLHWEQRTGADGARRTVLLLEPMRPAEQPEFLHRLGLTPREIDVTTAVIRGLTLKEIALQQKCSTHTANQHLKSVFLKLGISSRNELAARLLASPRT